MIFIQIWIWTIDGYLRKIGVQKDVISEEFVAVVPVDVGSAQLRLGLRLDAQQALDYDVVDLGPHVRIINPELLQMVTERW